MRGSIWMDDVSMPSYPRLDRDLEADVVIVGGGIVGLMSALVLIEHGRSVIVLEADRIASGVSGHTTGKVTSQHGVFYRDVIERRNTDVARTYAQANERAKEDIVALIEEHGLDARLERRDAFVYTLDDARVDDLEREAEASSEIGLPASFVTASSLPFPIAAAVRFEDQVQIHPRALLASVARRITELGGSIFEDSSVRSYEDGRPCEARTDRAVVKAGHVIIATNVPINDRLGFVPRMRYSRAYGIALPLHAPSIDGMFISADDPLRSLRTYTQDGNVHLIVVGEHHTVGEQRDTRACIDRLARWTQERFDVGALTHAWSTQDAYPSDSIPFIGRVSPRSERVFTATGLKGWGLAHSMVAARTFAARIAGEQDPWPGVYEPFAPGRVARNTVDPQTAGEQAHTASAFVSDRVRKKEGSDLQPGEGEIRDGPRGKIAVSRDEEGRLHVRSAVCTHMGCIVSWNDGERSWDCPCHGSRFSADGRVLHAPASEPLEDRSADLEGDKH